PVIHQVGLFEIIRQRNNQNLPRKGMSSSSPLWPSLHPVLQLAQLLRHPLHRPISSSSSLSITGHILILVPGHRGWRSGSMRRVARDLLHRLRRRGRRYPLHLFSGHRHHLLNGGLYSCQWWRSSLCHRSSLPQ
ncbi:Unknown protein, partial [Striga hermonthica]